MNLSGKQCKTARGLLKWNVRELEFRSTVRAKQIEMFEQGTKALMMNHREMLAKAFKKEGIVFLDFGEVTLEDTKSGARRSSHSSGNSKAHEVHIIDHDQMLALYDQKYLNARPTTDYGEQESPSLD
ncbi:MAG: hypothetical protein K2Q12_00660 [Rickettsiales bacterium]|nr:hypothetical protein [Rickettsiales bacterium]